MREVQAIVCVLEVINISPGTMVYTGYSRLLFDITLAILSLRSSIHEENSISKLSLKLIREVFVLRSIDKT